MTKIHFISSVVLGVALLAFGHLAHGQEPVEEQPVEEEPFEEPAEEEPFEEEPVEEEPFEEPVEEEPFEERDEVTVEEEEPMPLFPQTMADGFAASAGLGPVGFTDGDTRDFVDLGLGWDVRVTWGTDARIAVEGAYIGSRNDVEALGLDSDAYFLGTGLEANGLFHITEVGGLRPYGLAGVGWTRYSIEDENFNNSSLRDDDNVLHFPLGGGVSYELGRLFLDARATVRPAIYDELIQQDPAIDASASLTTWRVDGRVGFSF